jgi:hypothetical protein
MHCCAAAVALLLWAMAAGAQTVQKCLGQDGRARYQSAPCEPGERVIAQWAAEPEPEPVRAAVSQRPAPARTYRAPRAQRAASGRMDSPVDRCRAAKEHRDAVEKRVGLARTYELLSALNSQVYDACK